jgi:hypothetical protein
LNTPSTLKVLNTGTVGGGNITLGATDSAGDTIAPITIAATNTPVTLANGVTVQFGAGTLTQGDQFTINATVPAVQAAANASVTLGSGDGALAAGLFGVAAHRHVAGPVRWRHR